MVLGGDFWGERGEVFGGRGRKSGEVFLGSKGGVEWAFRCVGDLVCLF